jgi:polyisoprenoid-binding protein YceI
MMKCSVWTFGLLGLATSIAGAQSTTRLAVGQDSRLWIEGTSNVSAWSCKATSIDAEIEVELGYREAADFPRYVKSVRVKVPVADLKCGHDRMDHDLRKALDADDSAQTKYVTATFEAVGNGEDTGSVVHTVGTLTLAGHENTVKVDVNTTRLGVGGLEARGEVPILMTEYGIKPPTALFGAIRARDRVMVRFDLRVEPEAIAATAFTLDRGPALTRSR